MTLVRVARVAPAAAALAALAAGAPAAWAGELAPMTAISRTNIEEVKDMTFEGTRVADLIPERLEWQIREHGLKIVPMTSMGKLPYDGRLLRATEEFRGQPRLDPNTFQLLNYQAGIPFPTIDVADPLAGAKVIWNYTVAQPHGDQFYCPFTFNLIDGNSGIERNQSWVFSRYYMYGRVTGGPHVHGAGEIYHKSLLFATAPQDVRGLGTFSIRYWDPKFDDVWAYVRTVRRVRRLSGGAWMDPVGGTDHLSDDLETFNAHPAWYKGYKLLGKEKAFVVSRSQGHLWAEDPRSRWSWFPRAASLQEQLPRIDLSAAPYWNPVDVYEVRDVYVVESTPPEYHPMSKRVNWIDAQIFRPYYAAAYDRKGEFWKWIHFANTRWDDASGQIDPASGVAPVYMFTGWGVNIDHQRRHATFFNIAEGCSMNSPALTEDQFTLTVLEAAGR